MSLSFKVEDVPISAVRDRAMFNTFAGNQSYIIKGIGDELAVTYSSSSFIVELGTGEAVICGGSTLSEGEATALTLSANESGYIVIEVDLSQTGSNICRLARVPSLTQGDINNGVDMVYDLPLYQYTTDGSGVSDMTDVRNISSSFIADELLEKVDRSGIQNYDITGTTFKANNVSNQISITDNLINFSNVDLLMNDKRFKNVAIGNLDNVNYTCIKYVTGATNQPSDVAEYGTFACIMNATGLYGFQFYKAGNSSRLFYRSYQNGTWSTWRDFLVSGPYRYTGDLNDLKSNYLGYTNNNSNTPPTASNGSGNLLVIAREEGTNVTQIFKAYNEYDVYIRYQQSGTWKAWRRLGNFYEAGDTLNVLYAVTPAPQCSGVLSGSSKELFFTIPISRDILATGITFTKLELRARGVSGGYILGDANNTVDVMTSNLIDSVTTNVNVSGINVRVILKTAVSQTNNTPIVVEARNLVGTFS